MIWISDGSGEVIKCEGLAGNGAKFKTQNNNIVLAKDGRCMTGLSTKYVRLKECDQTDPATTDPVEWLGDDYLWRKTFGKLGISNAKYLFSTAKESKFQRLNPVQGEVGYSISMYYRKYP